LNHGLAIDSDLLAVFEEHESRHGCDAVAGCGVLGIVYIDLCERKNARDTVLRGESCVTRSNGFAWTAPVCVKVDHDIGRAGHECVELGRGGDVVKLVDHVDADVDVMKVSACLLWERL